MNKNFSTPLLILVLLGMLSSCMKYTEEKDALSPHKGIRFVFDTAEKTRVLTDASFKSVFEEGDAVGVFAVVHPVDEPATLQSSGNYVDNLKVVLTDGVWNIVADEAVYYPDGGDLIDFYAYYPYMDGVNPKAITYDAQIEMIDIMTARSCDLYASDEPVALTFQHKLALVEVNLTGYGVAVSMKDILPTALLDLSAALQQDELSPMAGGKVDLYFEKHAAGVYRAYIPPQPVAGGNIINITAGSAVSKYNSAGYDLEAGGARKYTIDPKIPDIRKYPNCYMVKPGQSVEIPVKKAYEIWRQEPFLQSQTPVDLTGTLTAELLWMDEFDLISAGGIVLQTDAGGVENSSIKVTVAAGKTGNAVVVAKIDGTIRWSWHIWATDYTPGNPTGSDRVYEYDNNSDGETDFIFMDRNLGARGTTMADIGTAGLYYQGARKDPFPGPANLASTSPPLRAIYNASGAIQVIFTQAVVDVNANMTLAVTNPLTFITSPGGEPYNWLSASTETSYGRSFWPSVLDNPEKTIYDPCPEGWTLPTRKNNMSPWATMVKTWTTAEFEENKGHLFPAHGYYFAAGRVRFDTGKIENCGYATYMYMGDYTNAKNRSLYLHRSTAPNLDGNYSRANGLSLRCVKE